MTKPVRLSIFFPTYNEEENIKETICRTIDVAEHSPYVSEYEILVINDGSTEATASIVEELSRQFSRVRLINHPKNLGYGAALKSGIAAARMDYIFFTDADLQFDIAELEKLLAYASDYPVVVGFRAPRRDPALRLLNAWGWNKLNRFLFGLKVRDIDCAFKLFRRDEIQSLTLSSNGAMISAEALIRLSREGVPIKEIPVSHLPRVAGSPTGAKLSVIARAFNEMLALYRGELGLATHKQALRFMSVGVLNTLLDAAAYIILTRETPVFSHHLVAAKFFSFLAGTVSSLLLNRSWTFEVRSRLTWGEIARFYAMTSLSITLNVAFMNLLVSFGMYDLYALAITTGLTFAANFTISKFWVFNQKTTPAQLEKQTNPYATTF